MVDIESAYCAAKEDIDSVHNWCNSLYSSTFSTYFQKAEHLFKKLQSSDKPITDSELSWILIDLPIHLFDASESLNKFRCAAEVVKMRNKQKERELIESLSEKNINARKEKINAIMINDNLLLSCYNSVISRVENQTSFCRELIMGAKKIWDSRRATEKSNPVSEVEELPVYPTKNKTYIHGGAK